MGKRSQRHPVRYEKDQSGCMWGLISIFDFRHGGSTRKLLSDRRRGNRPGDGAGFSKSKLMMLTDFEEKSQGTDDGNERMIATVDAGKPSVKKLIEEEMFSEQEPKKQISSTEVEQKQSASETGGHIRKNRKKTNKTRKKTCDIQIQDKNSVENSFHQNSEQQSVNLNLDAIMEELCSQIHQKSISCVEHDQQGEVHMQSNKKFSDFEEKISEATKVFINQKFVNGEHLAEDGKNHHSKEFMDALETLISNKELFLKLLQDPNSLLMKHIQNLQDALVEKDEKSQSLAGSNLSKKEPGNSRKSEELVNRKRNKFFRRKMKSQEISQSSEIENSQPSNRIVILKPGPAGLRNCETETSLGSSPQSNYIMRNNGLSERATSHFSFTEIRRKLKLAMGKDQQGISPDGFFHRIPYERQNSGDSDKGVGGENAGRTSPSRNHFYTERIPKPSIGVKKDEKTSKIENCEICVEHETGGYPNQRVSNIYTEAKKHLSEMLTNGDEYEDFSSRQVPKTLGRILSLPEYNFSPIRSPGRDWEHGFVTAQMRLSTHEKFRRVNESTWQLKQENNVSHVGPLMQELETRSCISDDNPDDKVQAPNSTPNISEKLIHDNEVEQTFCSIGEEMSSEGDVEVVKITDTVFQEESNVLDIYFKPSSSSITRDDRNGDTAEICDGKGYSECFKPDSFEENRLPSSPLASPSSSSITTKVEDLESAIDRTERPSPVSVLEPLFTEDDISPASTITPPVEPPISPLRIQFEEQDSSATDEDTHTKACMDDKQSIFEYVKAVLKASGLCCDEFFMRSLSSDQLLDPSLVDEVEFFSNRLCYEQKLLFDCIDEVLMEVCERYFGCSPLISFVKPNIRPVPNMENAICEVWEGVEWYLLPDPPPRSLDQIVRKDMAKTGRWMDLRFDAESVGVEMGEIILSELMEDTILSCIDESSETSFPEILAESNENESSINL
ncbi:hypothetical protein L1049_018056 [Liquidambar formosana]|uniref:DUF4378 domain-containing protein n=1 Tax=Liquidambar formosana TaxID=63359 RepID=A0AAP0NN20_LIQFO